MSRTFNLALVGATGLVGEALLALLDERQLPIATLHLLASPASAGRRLEYHGHYLKVADLADCDFSAIDIALFAVPPAVSARYSPGAAEQGCMVVDLSGIWLADPQVPVVLPGINEAALADARERNLVAVAAGIAAQVAPLVAALLEDGPAPRLALTALLPASAAGRGGVEELARQTARLLNSQDSEADVFPDQAAFATLTAGSKGCGSGMLAPAESARLALQRLFPVLAGRVLCQAARVPVFFGQSVALDWFSEAGPAVDQALMRLAAAGIEVAEADVEGRGLPLSGTALTRATTVAEITSQQDGVGLMLWVSTDNVRESAAMKGVQIVELLIKDYL